MKYLLFSIFTFFISSIYAQDISWKRHDVNGHITGVTQGPANKTEESMGKVKNSSLTTLLTENAIRRRLHLARLPKL